MIKILGAKRIVIVLMFIGINVALAGAIYGYLQPQKFDMDRKLRAEKAAVTRLRGDISGIQIEFSQLEEQQGFYEELKEKGFFSRQGRNEAQILFQKIQEASGVISANVKVGAGKIVDNNSAGKSDHKLLQSALNIEVDAIEDVDVVKYIEVLQREMPGYITLNELTLSRKSDVSGQILQAIVGGANPALVTAKIEALWTTMIPESSVIQSERGR